MKYLLDSCAFIFFAWDDPRLTPAARGVLTDRSNELYLSSVSVWEMVVKHRLGKLNLPKPPDVVVPQLRDAYGIRRLPLDDDAVYASKKLPDLHRDPFDRLLLSQAMVGGMTLVTSDEQLHAYPVNTLW